MPLTTRQMEYAVIAWECQKSEAGIDYDKFAEAAGSASSHSARELWRVTRKKMKEEFAAISAAVKEGGANKGKATGPKTPTTSPRKRAAPSTGTGKKSGSKKAATPAANGGGEGSDDEETPARKKAKKGSATPAPKARVNVAIKEEPKENGHLLDDDEGDYFT